MEAKAHFKAVRMGPRKMRVVANQVRGQKATAALTQLQFMPKKAARIIEKCLSAAVANAVDKEDSVDVDSLVIDTIFVDAGPVYKSFMPRAQGRADRIRHRTSHLTIRVSDGE